MINKIQTLKSELFGEGMLNVEDRYSKVLINHIPMMITDTNKILCIPRSPEMTHIGFCYDKETETLTNKGFKKFSEINRSDLVAQVDPITWEVEFVKPINYFSFHYDGEMINFKSKVIDLLVTPNHSMYARNRRDECTNLNKYQFLPAHRLLRGDWRIKQACSKNKSPVSEIKFPPDFFGIWLAEGCKYGKNGVEIYQKKPENLRKIKQMLDKNGIVFKERIKKTCNSLTIHWPEFAEYSSQFGTSRNKFIPDWIKNNSNEVIQKFLDWFFLGDGSLYDGRKRYHTSSKKLADDIQECLLKIGITSSIYHAMRKGVGTLFPKDSKYQKIVSPIYTVVERDTTHACLWNKKNKKVVKYSDMVYCLEVPTHLLVIRRNRKLSLCGNCAMTGKGKGIGGNTLLGFEYWQQKQPCMLLNDFQQETLEQSRPSNNESFNENLKIINTKPIAYPMVYVYPSSRELKIGETEKQFPHLKMSLPTRVIIKNIENFYKLDKSAKYVTGYIDKFLGCRDLEDIDSTLDEILEEAFPDQKGKKFEEMKFKIRTVFKNIFDEKITDSASPDAPAFLTINRKGLKNYHNFTIQALIACGFIPSIQTSEIRTESWFSGYMAFIVESIYRDKFKDPFLKNVNLSMYVPEIDKMWKGNDGDLIKTALSLIGTNGRRAGIGLRWDAQNYDKIPDAIRANTKYLFVLRMGHADDVREIKKDFGVGKTVQEQILSLETDASKGKFECVALTMDRFLLYNLRDGSVRYTNAPQKGRLITPLAQHHRPGTKIGGMV